MVEMFLKKITVKKYLKINGQELFEKLRSKNNFWLFKKKRYFFFFLIKS